MSGEDELLVLCDAAEVGPSTPKKIETGDEVYAVFEVDGTYYVTQDECTHGPGSLSEGYVDGHLIECPFHQGQFDIRTGEVVTPPCTVALRTWCAKLRDGKIAIHPKKVQVHD